MGDIKREEKGCKREIEKESKRRCEDMTRCCLTPTISSKAWYDRQRKTERESKRKRENKD